MNLHQINETLISCDYAYNNVAYSVVANAAGVHYLHVHDFDTGRSFLKLTEAELEEALEIADAFPERDCLRARAFQKMAQRLRQDRYLR